MLDILKNTFLITGLVMVMLLLIEYVNVRSQGHSLRRLQQSPWGQVVAGALLGLVPGCIGGFAVVSLFAHRLLGFGALVAMMIATTGDEAFMLLAASPAVAAAVFAILFVLAVAVGWTANRYMKPFPPAVSSHLFEVHAHEHALPCGTSFSGILKNFRPLSWRRAVLLGGLLAFVAVMSLGLFDHRHILEDNIYSAGLGNILFGERWLNLLFAVVSLVAVSLIASADNHFLEEHLWKHVVQKHFLKIFLWTLGALTVVHLLLAQVQLRDWMGDNLLLMLLIAVLAGVIPESGPHMIFISLFAAGAVPFSVLLTNCFVQDGHTALPLLAENPRAFIWVKGLKIALGLAIGLSGYFLGF
ncbi:MAG: putative manganese transporter [Prevotellaceae bacterium]|jgi:hypothetical protein|nr:putative manganese transporter [Prevotellaceae bacterium]